MLRSLDQAMLDPPKRRRRHGSGRRRSANICDSSSASSSCSSSSASPFRMIHCRRPQWDDGGGGCGKRKTPQVSPPVLQLQLPGSGSGGAYSQMPMRAFMVHKDWRQLLNRRDCGKLAKCKLSGSKYNRMLYSYHRLYQEYQYVCTFLLPRSRGNCIGGGGEGGGLAGCDEELLIGLGPVADTADSAAGGGDTGGGRGVGASAAIAAASSNAFGSVLMADRNFRVQRSKKRRSVVSHRVLTRTADGVAAWLDVPIAVELLLPRLQEQIKAVMGACPHVSDPLEVLAELRANRYDTERCVEYLRETLPLREVVRDILSVRSGRCGDLSRKLHQHHQHQHQNQHQHQHQNQHQHQHQNQHQHQHQPVIQLPPLPLDDPDEAPHPMPSPTPTAFPSPQPSSNVGTAAAVAVSSCSAAVAASAAAVAASASASAAAAPPAGDGAAGRPLLRGVRQLKDDLRVVRTSLRSVAAAMAAGLGKVRCHLSVQLERSRRLNQRDGAGAAQQAAAMTRMQKCVDELRHKCKEEEARRRTVFNALQEQLGNIRVYCRCTRVEGEQMVETVGAESVRMRGQQQDEFFRFDRVFGPDAPQESLFEELKPLITSFLDGFNVCFITYGGEASGKTFTLLGSSKQRGLVYRAMLAVLKEVANREADWHMELDSACLEIYNDACFDLLSDRTGVNLSRDSGLGAAFSALQRAPIREEKDVTDLLRLCAVRRRAAKTALNPKSSRSHLVHLIRLQAKSRVHGHTACSYLGMMDLAGAENIVKADTWREPERAAEAGHINRSLAAFNRLFLTLRRTPPSAACYREARLTQMMKPFLVNHGKCCIIVTVRTDQGSASTTMSTLRFGRDARQVALGKAQRQLLNVN